MKERAWQAGHVTVAILNYNGRQILPDCLQSIGHLVMPPAEVILVDDGSTDGSVAWLRQEHPQVRVIEMGVNTARLNRVRNRALAATKTDLMLMVDNDVVLAADCLEQLLQAMAALPHAAVCMPRTLYEHDPERIYQDGQTLHYVGATQAMGRNLTVAEADTEPRISIGWGVQLIQVAPALELGGFTEEYVMGWGDDGEFNHRMNLANHLCYHVPASIVFHKRVSGAQRYYGSVRNRWRFILECYQLRTLILAAPALAAYEIASMVFLALKGALGQYLRGMGAVVRQLPNILRRRRRVQAQRRLPDRDLFTGGDIFVSTEYLGSGLLSGGYRLMNGLLRGYWRLVRPLI